VVARLVHVPGNAPEPLSAERKATSVNARQIRNFKNAARCNGKEFHSWIGEFIEMPGVLGRQRVDPTRPPPFSDAGISEFNALIWMPPSGPRAGDIVLIDSTHFTTLFGGTDSLRNLWHNLATMAKSPATTPRPTSRSAGRDTCSIWAKVHAASSSSRA
jgi:hypothetical protein